MDNNDSSHEFVARQEITLQMTLTPDQHCMFNKWSEMIPTLYMLDICVVGATKLTDESLKNQPRKASLIAKLHYLDQPNNCFSYFCALMEKVSDSRGTLTSEELEKQILADLSALRKFFKNARIAESDDFAIMFLKELKGDPIESNRTEYLIFLKILNDYFKLHNSISSKKRLAKAKEIIKKASALTISIQHPIVTISLACLYGNLAAKKLMKFKANPNKFNAENALADILLISRFAKLKLQMEHYGRDGSGYARVNFITDDNGLSEIVKHFKPRVVKHEDKSDGRESELTMTVEFKKILTEIEEEEYSIVVDLLSQ